MDKSDQAVLKQWNDDVLQLSRTTPNVCWTLKLHELFNATYLAVEHGDNDLFVDFSWTEKLGFVDLYVRTMWNLHADKAPGEVQSLIRSVHMLLHHRELLCAHLTCVSEFVDPAYQDRNRAIRRFIKSQNMDMTIFSTCETSTLQTLEMEQELKPDYRCVSRCTGRLSPRENKGTPLHECDSETWVNEFLSLYFLRARFNLLEDEYIDLPPGPKHPRGVLRVRLEDVLFDRQLDVFVSHLDHLSAEQRLNSFVILHQAMIKSRAQGAIPILMMDSNNFPDQSPRDLKNYLTRDGIVLTAAAEDSGTFYGRPRMNGKFGPVLVLDAETCSYIRDGPLLDVICYHAQDLTLATSGHYPVKMQEGDTIEQALMSLNLASDHAMTCCCFVMNDKVDKKQIKDKVDKKQIKDKVDKKQIKDKVDKKQIKDKVDKKQIKDKVFGWYSPRAAADFCPTFYFEKVGSDEVVAVNLMDSNPKFKSVRYTDAEFGGELGKGLNSKRFTSGYRSTRNLDFMFDF